MNPNDKPIAHEWAILLALAGVQISHILDFMILTPLEPQFMRMFAIGPTQFGFLVSRYTFSAAAMGFAAAFFIDRCFNAPMQQLASGAASFGASRLMGRNAAGELTHYGTVGIFTVITTLASIYLARRIRAA